MDVSNSAGSRRKRRYSSCLSEDLPDEVSDEPSSPKFFQSDSPSPELVITTHKPGDHGDSKEYSEMNYRDFLNKDNLSSLSQVDNRDNNNCEEDVKEDELSDEPSSPSDEFSQSDSPSPELVNTTHPPEVHGDPKLYSEMNYKDYLNKDNLSSSLSQVDKRDNNNCEEDVKEDKSPCNSPETVRRQEISKPKASVERIITSDDQIEITVKSRNTQNTLNPTRSRCISLTRDQNSPAQIPISRDHDARASPRRSSVAQDMPPQISTSRIQDATLCIYTIVRDASSQTSLPSVHQTDSTLRIQKVSPRIYTVARDASSQTSLPSVHQTDSTLRLQEVSPRIYTIVQDASSQTSLSNVHQTDSIPRIEDASLWIYSVARHASSQTLSSVHQTDSRTASSIALDMPPQISTSRIQDATTWRCACVQQTASRISSSLSHDQDTPLQILSPSIQKASPERASVIQNASNQTSLSSVHQTDSRTASCIALDMPPQISTSRIQDTTSMRYTVVRGTPSEIILSSVHQTDSRRSSCIALDTPTQISSSRIQDDSPCIYSVGQDASSQISLSGVHQKAPRISSSLSHDQDTPLQVLSPTITSNVTSGINTVALSTSSQISLTSVRQRASRNASCIRPPFQISLAFTQNTSPRRFTVVRNVRPILVVCSECSRLKRNPKKIVSSQTN